VSSIINASIAKLHNDMKHIFSFYILKVMAMYYLVYDVKTKSKNCYKILMLM